MKKLFDFNFTFKDFEGNDIKVIDTAGNEVPGGLIAWRELGSQLAASATKDGNTAVKYFGLAQQLGKDKALELDSADTNLLKEFIGTAHIRADFKAQLLGAIEKGKEVK